VGDALSVSHAGEGPGLSTQRLGRMSPEITSTVAVVGHLEDAGERWSSPVRLTGTREREVVASAETSAKTVPRAGNVPGSGSAAQGR
jgi:hypothetical protein